MAKTYFVLLVTLLLSSAASAAEDVRIALLADDNAAAIADMLIPRLSGAQGIALVERNDIDQILSEQELTALRPANSMAGRIRLGQLLGAHLLVVMEETGTAEKRSLSVSVMETEQGVRVFSGKVAGQSVETMSDFVENACLRSLKKCRGEFKAIFAVPPFENHNLTHDEDHLQAVLAQICAQYLGQADGTLVVELEEAHAISQELALTGERSRVDRRLPFYVEGDYSHEGLGADRRISLQLRLRRGDRIILEKKNKDMHPDDVADALAPFADSCLEAADAVPSESHARGGEAEELAKRAKEFERFAHYGEALALYEAALLLEPKNEDWHWRAGVTAGRVTHALFDPHHGEEVYRRKARKAAAIFRRGVHHFVKVLRVCEPEAIRNELSQFYGVTACFRRHSQPQSELGLLFEAIDNEKRHLIIDVIRERKRNGTLTDEFYKRIKGYAITGRKTPGKYEERWELICLVKHLPSAERWIKYLIDWGISRTEYEQPEFQRFLERVERLPLKSARSAVAAMRDEIRQKQEYYKQPDRPRVRKEKSVPEGQVRVRFTELKLRVAGKTGRAASPDVCGWLDCGRSGDILWTDKSLYQMSDPDGVLRELYRSDREVFRFSGPSYDGQYAWFPVQGDLNPLIVLVEPATGRIRTFTKTDGLLPMTHGVSTAPLAKGKIFISVQFGSSLNLRIPADRYWCATLSCGKKGSLEVDVLHKAPCREDPEAVILGTSFAFAFPPPAEQKPRQVLLNHKSSKYAVVDLQDRSVQIQDGRITPYNKDRITRHGNSLYWVGYNRGQLPRTHSIWTINGANVSKVTRIQADPDPMKHTFIVFGKNAVYLIAEAKCYAAESIDKPFSEVGTNMPRCQYCLSKLFRSSNYGWVYLTNNRRRNYHVEFPE